jgi:hypothetical protein
VDAGTSAAPQRATTTTSAWRAASLDLADAPVAAFPTAGWRRGHVVAPWLPDADEPWTLATSMPDHWDVCEQYARRWSIDWKSTGWDLEHLHLPTPARVGRLLTGMVLATW